MVDCTRLLLSLTYLSSINFLLPHSEEPTKTDNDVFKALHNVEINEKTYPNIHQWYTALQSYSLQEREK